MPCIAAKPEDGFKKWLRPWRGQSAKWEVKNLVINHLPQQWEGEENEAHETRSFELCYNYTYPLSIPFVGLKRDMGAFYSRSEAPSFTKISVLLSYFFKALTLTSHLIVLPVSEALRAGDIFLILQLMELCDTAEFSNFLVITQPAGDGTGTRIQTI